jgi:hypothetical protein
MVDIGIVESSNYLEDRIDTPNMGEELVSESLPFRGSLDESCDIDEFDGRRDDLGSIDDRSNLLETFIIHIHDTYIGFYSTKWKIRCLCSIGLRESIKESRFSDIRETDNTNLHEEIF